MSDDKTVVLLKAAKELNIGLATAVEFLGKKGYAVDNKPNTKLSGEMYNVLLREFQGDKIVKEEANQIVIGKIRRDEPEVTTEKTPEAPKKNADFESEGVLIKNINQYTPPVEKTEAEKQAQVATSRFNAAENLANAYQSKLGRAQADLGEALQAERNRRDALALEQSRAISAKYQSQAINIKVKSPSSRAGVAVQAPECSLPFVQLSAHSLHLLFHVVHVPRQSEHSFPDFGCH